MVDDEDRENEGDLVFAAEHVDAAKINFMVREARGLVCLTLDPATVDRLRLPLMVAAQSGPAGAMTAFTVSIEARHGVSTGISAHDRAQTIRVAIADRSIPEDLVVPGHVFPLRSKVGGVLERAGHTEGSVDICRLAGLKSAGVICEIMKDDGSMARRPDLDDFAAKHGLEIVSIADIIQFRLLKESLVEKIEERELVTSHGTVRGIMFRSRMDQGVHLALVKGTMDEQSVTDVRVHPQRPLVDVLAPRDSVSGSRIEYGLKMLGDSDNAVLLYLQQPAVEAAWLGDFEDLSKGELEPVHRPPMDMRVYGTGAQILRDLGVRKMIVHMTTPRTLKALNGFGLEIVGTKIIPQESCE